MLHALQGTQNLLGKETPVNLKRKHIPLFSRSIDQIPPVLEVFLP